MTVCVCTVLKKTILDRKILMVERLMLYGSNQTGDFHISGDPKWLVIQEKMGGRGFGGRKSAADLGAKTADMESGRPLHSVNRRKTLICICPTHLMPLSSRRIQQACATPNSAKFRRFTHRKGLMPPGPAKGCVSPLPRPGPPRSTTSTGVTCLSPNESA